MSRPKKKTPGATAAPGTFKGGENMIEYVLFGVKPGEKYESFIGEYGSEADYNSARNSAENAGYTGLRLLIYRGEAPDFIAAINSSKRRR
jgi:hypothetical protein